MKRLIAIILFSTIAACGSETSTTVNEQGCTVDEYRAWLIWQFTSEKDIDCTEDGL